MARNPETRGQKSRRTMARHNYKPLLESKTYLARNHQTYEARNCKHMGRTPAKCGQKSWNHKAKIMKPINKIDKK